ncbi:hypothetical protein FSP39_009708 [Pinctada imbricata]|uniref:Uncharacterized protein n=1 Tax=Pinctada imbricata TaxID=66713 RepID=A0AA89BK96_PINIB|nr:hypothetical protein FSP39_009708 [Pinctada imbricata]
MGSIEVYDTKLAKWVPYIPDYKKWEEHFKDISKGRVRPDHKGRYIVGSGSRINVTPKQPKQPKLTLVTPVAQAVEMAKSELKREGNVIREGKRKAGPPGIQYEKLRKKNGYTL